ncbi:MAG: hypothetical protein OXH66_08850 [Gemmatimonadetes bacterium]|nr:hypothetical protein [Gemmatimonadota bacterium]
MALAEFDPRVDDEPDGWIRAKSAATRTTRRRTGSRDLEATFHARIRR